jgi:aminoglycoside phosphotransferase (APT) family kinase protein
MDFVDGHILRSRDEAMGLAPEARARCGDSLVEVLARIHAVDVDAVGLGELGRRAASSERQLRRWHGQFEKSKLREVPLVDDVHARLAASVPDQQGASIVHGDYRLDNTMVGDDGRVRAVLDWEICTLGDALADVGLLLVYCPSAGDPRPLGDTPNLAPGFPSRAELLERYASRSGRDLRDIGFYVAFGYWKLACIIDGVYTRYAKGDMAADGYDFQQLDEQVVRLAEAADATLRSGI